MINRELRPVEVITFISGKDDYGQRRQLGSTSRNVEMVCKINYQYNSNNPLFNEIDVIGITEDHNISSSNQIKIDNVLYNVKYIIPSNRYYQVLMQKVK